MEECPKCGRDKKKNPCEYCGYDEYDRQFSGSREIGKKR